MSGEALATDPDIPALEDEAALVAAGALFSVFSTPELVDVRLSTMPAPWLPSVTCFDLGIDVPGRKISSPDVNPTTVKL